MFKTPQKEDYEKKYVCSDREFQRKRKTLTSLLNSGRRGSPDVSYKTTSMRALNDGPSYTIGAFQYVLSSAGGGV